MSGPGPKRWSLYEIEVLSHHHVSPAPFPRERAPGYPVVIDKLRELGLMEPETRHLTYLGRELLNAICSTPIPTPNLSPREDGVDEALKGYGRFINERPMLLSLLYDIDMLPEQCVTLVGASRLVGLCEVWRLGESGRLPPPPEGSGQKLADANSKKAPNT